MLAGQRPRLTGARGRPRQVYGFQGIKGGQSSEHLLGRFSGQQGAGKVVLGTKFFTLPWTNIIVRRPLAAPRPAGTATRRHLCAGGDAHGCPWVADRSEAASGWAARP